MGRASRWLRNFISGGGNKNKECVATNEERKEKKRWSFGKPSKDSGDLVLGQNESTAAAIEAVWLRSFYGDREKEQSKHAIAIAAATAAAADAAVVAAQAAVEVVRLTSKGKGAGFRITGNSYRTVAAVRIQKTFRGYLARKALRALKALVKLQALVRGFLVRKKAAATYHSMQALIRAQTAVQAQRARSSLHYDRRFEAENRPRHSMERFDEARCDNLLSIRSRRLLTTTDKSSGGSDQSPKIVEIDTIRPKSRSSRRTTSPSVVDSDEEMHPYSLPSPLASHIPTRLSIPGSQNFENYDCCLRGEKCRLSATAQSTPRYMNLYSNIPGTPAKSVCGADGACRQFLNASNCPSYMSKTQSFEAKVRSQSAPKQRPETARMRKRMPLSKVMVEARASISEFGIQNSGNRGQVLLDFKNAVVGRIDRSRELLGREIDNDLYLHRKW